MLGLLIFVLLVAAVISLLYRATVGLAPGGLLGILALIVLVILLTRA